jgi:Protein of unknown function (DUF1559)
VSNKQIPSYAFSSIPHGQDWVNYSSYGGSAGVFYTHPATYDDPGVASVPSLTAQCNGIYYVDSAVRIASITDGTSNTLLFGERAHSLLSSASVLDWQWWFDGYYSPGRPGWFPTQVPHRSVRAR